MAPAYTPFFRTEEVCLGSATMVRLHGELDVQFETYVADGFTSALSAQPAAVAADLRGLTFMDSTGVHALIEAQARCRTHGVRFFVIRGSATVNRVLSALGLERLFDIISGPEQLPGDIASMAATG